MRNCPVCGYTVQPDARYCEACGVDLSQPQQTGPAPDQPASANKRKERLAILKSSPAKLSGAISNTIGAVRGTIGSLWKSKKGTDAQAQRANAANQEPEKPIKRSRRIFNIILAVLTGAGVIALWIWLLMRRTGERMVRSLLS